MDKVDIDLAMATALRRHWGFTEFRPHQQQIVKSVVDQKRDVSGGVFEDRWWDPQAPQRPQPPSWRRRWRRCQWWRRLRHLNRQKDHNFLNMKYVNSLKMYLYSKTIHFQMKTKKK